jgi:hypothetical protein
MGSMRASIIGTDPVGQPLGGQKACGFHDRAFAMGPLGLAGVQPRAFTGQPAGENADATPQPFDLTVMGAEPGADHLAGMPRSIVPHEQ